MANIILGSGPIILGILMILGQKLKWPYWTSYLFGAIAILYGLFLLL